MGRNWPVTGQRLAAYLMDLVVLSIIYIALVVSLRPPGGGFGYGWEEPSIGLYPRSTF